VLECLLETINKLCTTIGCLLWDTAVSFERVVWQHCLQSSVDGICTFLYINRHACVRWSL